MIELENRINEYISLLVSGKKHAINGIIVDAGNDVLVIYDGLDFVYVSSHHIQDYQFVEPEDDDIFPSADQLPNKISEISLRKVMEKAKGFYTEIFMTGNQSIHGYITAVMNDYFAFYSPIHHSVYCSLKHLKWIKPYSADETPYGLNKSQLPFMPCDTTLSRSFEDLIKKSSKRLVILDLGTHPRRIGKMEQLQNQLMELTLGRRQKTYVNTQHIKTISFRD